MASILDLLPTSGQGVLFAGRQGAVRLPNGQILLVTTNGASIVSEAIEPPDNGVWSPDESTPAERPRYMDAFPFSFAPLPPRPARLFHIGGQPGVADPLSQSALDPWPWAPGPWSGTEQDWNDLALRVWAARLDEDNFGYQDAYTAAVIRTCEALRQALVHGSEPAALTYDLYFGDVDDPEVMYQLRKAVEGLADAAQMFELPFLAGQLQTSADIGLYPRLTVRAHGVSDVFSAAMDAMDVIPSPARLAGEGWVRATQGGAAGQASRKSRQAAGEGRWSPHLASPASRAGEGQNTIVGSESGGLFSGAPIVGDLIAVIGRMTNDISGSLLLATCGVTESFPPPIDLIAEKRTQELLRTAVSEGLVSAALDCRRGGLLITLAECFASVGSGVMGSLPASWQQLSPAALLFGEAQSRFVVSLPESALASLVDAARALEVPIEVIGAIGGDELAVRDLVDLRLAAFSR